MTRDEMKKQIIGLRERQKREDLAALMKLPAGRRFLWRLIDEIAGVHAASYVRGSAHETAHREGRRWVGHKVMLEAQRVSPSEFVHMVGEASERRERERLALEAADAAGSS